MTKLAIEGGEPVRKDPMPFREAFGPLEEQSLLEAIRYFRENKIDPPYDGIFEKKYCAKFERFMGRGHADAVSSGTVACYIAVAA